VSAKRAKLKRETDKERFDFLTEIETCMVPGCDATAAHCHEIARGYAREGSLRERRMQMGLCRKHHELFDDYKKFPPAKQIEIRIRWEIEQTAKLYCELRGLAPSAVAAEEIIFRLAFNFKKRKKAKHV
jgi:hypothetical protein